MFSDFLNFIKNHYELIGSIILVLISVISFILKKRPLGNVYSFLFRVCLQAVVWAEEHPVKGQEKKELAIDAVHELLLREYPKLKVSNYDNDISEIIEAILETPQKKK